MYSPSIKRSLIFGSSLLVNSQKPSASLAPIAEVAASLSFSIFAFPIKRVLAGAARSLRCGDVRQFAPNQECLPESVAWIRLAEFVEALRQFRVTGGRHR